MFLKPLIHSPSSWTRQWLDYSRRFEVNGHNE